MFIFPKTANTEYSRLDFIATEKLNAILDSQTLPTVSASDAGKVLIVGEDGKWKAATLEEAGIAPAEEETAGS